MAQKKKNQQQQIEYSHILNKAVLETNDGQLEGLQKNPRFIKDEKFAKLKHSLEQSPEFLKARPLLVYPMDNGHYIIAGGNMRFLAGCEVGITDFPCYIFPKETTVDKLREYVIKDNLAYGSTDWELIANEWDADELGDWGMDIPDFLGDEEQQEEEEQKSKDDSMYSRNLEIPVYQITGKEPSVSECVDTTKAKEILQAIDKSQVSDEQKEMLRICAYRHAVINFENMAEYYAHQGKEMQQLMEDNALVLVDFNKAIEKGFVEMSQKLLAIIPDKVTEEDNERNDYDEE